MRKKTSRPADTGGLVVTSEKLALSAGFPEVAFFGVVCFTLTKVDAHTAGNIEQFAVFGDGACLACDIAQ